MEHSDFFVAMPNKMFAFGTEYFANDDEFLLFYYLGTIVQARDTSIVLGSIDLISSTIDIVDSNVSRKKKRLMTALLSLEKKGYISIDTKGFQIQNSTALKIKLINLKHPIYTESVKSGSWTYMGFTQVTDKMFLRTENVKQLKILTYVTWRSGIEYKISYSEWEKVLGVSHQTAVNSIQYCHRKGIIVKHRGDYYTTNEGEIRQETNKYTIREENLETEFNPTKEINTVSKAWENQSKSIETRENNWFKTGDNSKINENDMYIYLTTKCDVLKVHAEKRINGLNKSAGKKLIEGLKRKAEEKIRNENTQKIVEKISGENEQQMIEDLIDSYNRPHTWKKQHDTDLSELLGDD